MRNPVKNGVAAVCAVACVAVIGALLPAGASASEPAAGGPAAGGAGSGTVSVDLVDGSATAETRSLFAYLRGVRGEHVLFGQQHATDYGESFETPDGTAGDVRAATGDHPAVFGFDTLIIEGRERPGDPEATREQNALTLAESIARADELGAISTLSAHVENLATGGDFYDTSGDALRAVLPGGDRNEALNDYLDLVALAADHAVDADGTPIPIVFRPWHENAGSWFWWGAAFGTPGEYAELFRYTVEYLRDVKGVHNLLYAFSPGGGFGGDAERYLRTYPGDEFVDVLGYDTYDPAAGEGFLAGLVDDLGMIARLADERGKISAFTEFGITDGVRPDGENANTSWYTDVLGAIMADPDASRSAYMLTWANFGGDTAPYTPVDGEMLPDFLAFHDDEATLFAGEVDGAYDIATDAVPAAPTAHLASPASGARVAAGPVTLRASVRGYGDVERAYVEVADTAERIELAAPAEGSLWWTGEWAVPDELLDNSTRALSLHVVSGEGETVVGSTIIAGPRPELPRGVVDDFEGYGDDDALRAEYVQYGANTISLERASVGEGGGALRLDYDFATQAYTGVGRTLEADWSGLHEFRAWVDADGSGNTLVLQLVAGGVSFEAYPSLADDGASSVTIPFAEWRPAPWDTANAGKELTQERLKQVTQFNVYVNAADGGAASGSVVLDSLRAVEGEEPATTYRDVPREHADHDAIEWLHDEVIDLGDTRGRFHPAKPITAGELAEVLAAYGAGVEAEPGARGAARRLGVVEDLWHLAGEPLPAEPAAFRDVPAASADAAAWAIERGIVDAEPSGRFGATKPVTRAGLARMLHAVDALLADDSGAVIADFDGGDGGWAIASWQEEGSAAAEGGRLIVDAADGGSWVGASASVDLSGRGELLVDVSETTGFDAKAALQVGPDWTWCETAQAGWTDAAGTVAIDLTTLSAECTALLDDVRGINVFLNEGHHELDAIRAR